MKKILATILLSTFCLVPANGFAANCAEKAAELAKQEGAEVVSVQTLDNACRVKVRVPSNKGKPPRVETRTINK